MCMYVRMYVQCGACVCVLCAYVCHCIVLLCHKYVSSAKRCLAKGDHIYKGKYEGWYSVTDEAFVTEQEVSGVCCQCSSSAE